MGVLVGEWWHGLEPVATEGCRAIIGGGSTTLVTVTTPAAAEGLTATTAAG